MTRWFSPLALTLALALSANAQLPPDRALAAMKPAEGFQVELFASEPMLVNPTSIDIDHKGRVWVAEAVNYRREKFGRPIIREAGDRIVVLIDTNADGKADEAKTFYQGKDLIAPLSVCVIPQANAKSLRVLVAQSPDILEFWDRDGDLKADGPPKKFLTGFRGIDHDHGVHGLSVGPDGKLYFTVGDQGVENLQSSDGKGRKWTSNNTDCRAGTVWRCDLDGTNLELIAHNFRNNYECCVNSFGEIWLSDNDDDGNQQTRICFVMPGGNYGYHPRGPGQTHWHEEQPGIVHKTLRTGFGSPTGITFYEGSLLPEKYRGQLLHTDAGPRELRCFHIKPKGAGYELEREVLLTSSDNWFRPSDVCVAPDGSIFVADWYDRGVGGHGMGDPTDGRIYRLTPKGHKGYKVPEVKLETKEGVLAALGSPCLATRALGQAAVQGLDLQHYGEFFEATWDKTTDPVLKARIAWMHPYCGRFGDLSVAEISRGLFDAGGVYREMAVRVFQVFQYRLGKNSSGWMETSDPKKFAAFSPAVRREFLLLARMYPADLVKPALYALAKLYDGQDHFYLAALSIACGTDPKRREAILADFDKQFPEWNDKVADLVWELRPKSVLPRLRDLLDEPGLTAAQKARIVDIIAANDDLSAGRTMLDVLKSDAAPEVKARAIASLRLFLPTKWGGLKGGKELTAAIDGLLKDAKTQATGLQLIAAADARDRIDDVAKIAADDKAPLELRKEAVRTLGQVPGPKSVEALIAIGAPKNALTIDCVNALGELLPRNAKGPAYGEQALDALKSAITLDASTPEIHAAALSALAASRVGTGWLLDAHQKGELPKEIVADAGKLLRNSPFQGERNRALLLFPAPGKLDPKKLPAIAELAKRIGDANKGKQVWNASFAGAAQCAKCHMVRGVGGQVGPDLSMIGKKASKENLFESILVPSKAIADQFIVTSVNTLAGQTIAGLLIEDSDRGVTLRDANGKDYVIAKDDIEKRVQSKVSIMPQDIVAGLTEDELIDLVAYLQTLQTAALTPSSFKLAGPFKAASMLEALGKPFAPEGAAGTIIEWRTLRPEPNGYFDLAKFHGTAAANSASYLLAEIESPADQDAEILLGTDDGAKLWVNGKEVFQTEATRAAAPGQNTVPVKLKKGKNEVLLKVANGNSPHGFYFTVLSKEETKVAGR